jgi:diaminobutyrate-2-oxoglutarate transaminase
MIFEKYESNVQSYAKNFPAVFSKAQGATIFDEKGRRYIDFLAGAGSLNYGHNDRNIKSKLIEYLSDDNIIHSLDLHTVAKRSFLESLNEIILQPRNFTYVSQFTGPTGTNAVEAAMKLARKATGRKNIISFTNGFHGVTLGALAAAGNSFYRSAAGIPTNNVTFMPYDNYFGAEIDTIKIFEQSLADKSSGLDLPAAVIVETIQGEGGLNVASNAWLQSLAKVCKKNGILLIVDDIQSGCGRTGQFFSFECSEISPDIVVMSKSLSGSGLPMSLVLIKPEFDVWSPGEHNGTFRGNNPAFVTAAAAINHYWTDNSLAFNVEQKSLMLKKRIEGIINKLGAGFQHKGRGFMQGLSCPDGEIAGLISKNAFANGLIIETCGARGHVLKFLMPLTISAGVMNEGLDILDHCVDGICHRGDEEKPFC